MCVWLTNRDFEQLAILSFCKITHVYAYAVVVVLIMCMGILRRDEQQTDYIIWNCWRITCLCCWGHHYHHHHRRYAAPLYLIMRTRVLITHTQTKHTLKHTHASAMKNIQNKGLDQRNYPWKLKKNNNKICHRLNTYGHARARDSRSKLIYRDRERRCDECECFFLIFQEWTIARSERLLCTHI